MSILAFMNPDYRNSRYRSMGTTRVAVGTAATSICRSSQQTARFFLMRQAVNMLSAAVYLLLGSRGKQIPEGGELACFHDFHRRIWAGEIDVADNELKVIYGRVHWARLCEDIRHPRFEEALRTVAEQNARVDDLFCYRIAVSHKLTEVLTIQSSAG